MQHYLDAEVSIVLDVLEISNFLGLIFGVGCDRVSSYCELFPWIYLVSIASEKGVFSLF